jgi:hypothetical protein
MSPEAVLRIRDVYPRARILNFYSSRIPDPKTATKVRGEKKIVVIPFFVATNFTKLINFLFLKSWKKNLAQFSKNYRNFYPKIWY